MKEYTLLEKEKSFDILILAEGTYPYVRGGVSSWIHHLISIFPEYKFGIVFLGSKKEDYGEVQYTFPENLVYLKAVFIFDFAYFKIKKGLKIKKSTIEDVFKLHKWYKGLEPNFPPVFHSPRTFYEDLEADKFLYSRDSFDFIVQNYLQSAKELPFIDYFWQIRNLHLPVLESSKICKLDFKCKVIHSPSTGYAGFLGSLLSYDRNIPFILTEHGIYVRERKIDIFSQEDNIYGYNLFSSDKSKLDIKKMWISLFEGLAKITYNRAFKIVSLFPKARDIQVKIGAPKEKCLVIPNGINLGIFKKEKQQRKNVIVNIGRVVKIKDIKTFIKAMGVLLTKKKDVEGWIVGPTEEDEEYARECLDLVAALGLEDKIKFLGFRKPEEILPGVKLLTLTSISEGMPLVILEAFACGVPVVATDVGACKDLIYGQEGEDKALGKAGEIVPLASPKEIARVYLDFLVDREKWQKASLVAQKRVHTFYSQKVFYNNYKMLYQEALSKWPV